LNSKEKKTDALSQQFMELDGMISS